jgi:HK97 family phage major capsid protein
VLKLHELQESRANKVAQLRSLITNAEGEGRDLSEGERSQFDALKSEIAGAEQRIARAATVAEMERLADAAPVAGQRHGAPDLSDYCVTRAIRGAANGKLDGLEAEMHAELSRGREMRGNVMIPTSVLLGEARSQSLSSAPKGGYLVATNIAATADRFRPSLLVESLGATVLRNLVGDIDLPNLASSGTSYWVNEDGNTTRSDVSFEKVSMTPKTISGEYQLSRRAMIQPNESIEALLRRDLGFLLAQGLDAAAIKSNGSPTQPTGILDSGIEKVATETAFTDTVANLIAALELDNVSGTRALLTNPTVMALARKLKDGEGNGIPLSSTFHNERVEVTTQVPTNIGVGSNKSALICGMFSELFVAYFSGVDILANPYHSDVASKGGLLLHAFLDCDVAVRHPIAFAYAEI